MGGVHELIPAKLDAHLELIPRHLREGAPDRSGVLGRSGVRAALGRLRVRLGAAGELRLAGGFLPSSVLLVSSWRPAAVTSSAQAWAPTSVRRLEGSRRQATTAIASAPMAAATTDAAGLGLARAV